MLCVSQPSDLKKVKKLAFSEGSTVFHLFEIWLKMGADINVCFF